MKRLLLYLSVLFFFLHAFCGAGAQGLYLETEAIGADTTIVTDTVTKYTVGEILIDGNRRTRDNIILRELTFKLDRQYTLQELSRLFRESKQFLMNTGLFHEVIVSLNSIEGASASVQIAVKERWYIQPAPVIRVIDEGQMNMRRVNYGGKVTFRNFTGRNDGLSVYVLTGFNRQLRLGYSGIYLDKALKWSAGFGATYSKTHSMRFMTVDNKPLEYKNSQRYVQTLFTPNVYVSYRPAIRTRHTFGFGYHVEDIADTLSRLNPAYAYGHRTIRYTEASYTLAYTDVDFIPYPLKGRMYEVWLLKKGFGGPFNLWQLTLKSSLSWPLSEKNFFNLRSAGMVKLPFAQPYIMQPLLGSYSNLGLQGFEQYTLDGVAGGYIKGIFLRQLIHTNVPLPKRGPMKRDHMPLRVYGKIFANAGYAYHPDAESNGLNNKILYAGGIGVDIITLTDFVIKLEWSFNQLGGNGLSLRRRTYY